jgi:hypothetical protein
MPGFSPALFEFCAIKNVLCYKKNHKLNDSVFSCNAFFLLCGACKHLTTRERNVCLNDRVHNKGPSAIPSAQ